MPDGCSECFPEDRSFKHVYQNRNLWHLGWKACWKLLLDHNSNYSQAGRPVRYVPYDRRTLAVRSPNRARANHYRMDPYTPSIRSVSEQRGLAQLAGIPALAERSCCYCAQPDSAPTPIRSFQSEGLHDGRDNELHEDQFSRAQR